jgi:hypothetical protein
MDADWVNIAPWLVDAKGQDVLSGQIACRNQENLALIAAAPDLYEALELMAKVYRNEHGLDGAFDSCLTLAEKALAKARGDNPTISTKPNQ